MKKFNIAIALFALILGACNNNSNETTVDEPFCKDTTCMTEPIKVTSNAPGKPFIVVAFKDCKIDSIHYEKGGMGVIKDITFAEFIDKDIKPAKEAFDVKIFGGTHAWLRFNDCATGRGYAVKLGFDKNVTEAKYTSAINNFDPKFKVADGLVAYYDNTFIYVQDMETDKVAQQLLTDVGVRDINYNKPHSLIDSVNITKENIYAKIFFDGKTIEHNKPLEFK